MIWLAVSSLVVALLLASYLARLLLATARLAEALQGKIEKLSLETAEKDMRLASLRRAAEAADARAREVQGRFVRLRDQAVLTLARLECFEAEGGAGAALALEWDRQSDAARQGWKVLAREKLEKEHGSWVG